MPKIKLLYYIIIQLPHKMYLIYDIYVILFIVIEA